RFVCVGLVCLICVAALGGLFSLSLSGVLRNTVWLALAGNGASIHAALGLGGWMSFTAMGVSYRLLGMFMLSPDNHGPVARTIWWSGAGALASLAVSLVLVVLGYGSLELLLLAALVPGLASIALYIW